MGSCARSWVGKGNSRLMTNQDVHNGRLDAWRDQIEQSLGEQEVGQALGRESAGAYEDFLDSLFFYYGESMRAVEEGTKGG